jgi:hypothetical protein
MTTKEKARLRVCQNMPPRRRSWVERHPIATAAGLMGGAAVVFGAMRRSRAQSDYTLAPKIYSAHDSAYYVDKLGLAEGQVEALMSSPAGRTHLDNLNAIESEGIRKKAAQGDYLEPLGFTSPTFDLVVSCEIGRTALAELDNIPDAERHAWANELLKQVILHYRNQLHIDETQVITYSLSPKGRAHLVNLDAIADDQLKKRVAQPRYAQKHLGLEEEDFYIFMSDGKGRNALAQLDNNTKYAKTAKANAKLILEDIKKRRLHENP